MLTMLIATFVVLVVFRFSIAMALGLSCAAAIVFFSNISPIVMVQRMVVGVDSFVLLAIPLFVLSCRLRRGDRGQHHQQGTTHQATHAASSRRDRRRMNPA